MTAIDRRAFLAATGAVTGSALTRGAVASTGDAPPSYDEATAVLYDATKCIGCRSCQRACRVAAADPRFDVAPGDRHVTNCVASDLENLSDLGGQVDADLRYDEVAEFRSGHDQKVFYDARHTTSPIGDGMRQGAASRGVVGRLLQQPGEVDHLGERRSEVAGHRRQQAVPRGHELL